MRDLVLGVKAIGGCLLVVLFATPALAQPDQAPDEPPPTPVPPVAAAPLLPALALPAIQIHGFASEGGFVSTANDYLGNSSQGSLSMFEAGINFSTEVSDRLRVGMQLYSRDLGRFKDFPPRLDWAYLDYHWRSWLGVRAGIVKMPYGLYNEYADIDSSRLSILLPQGVYPIQDRSVLLAQTGFSLYGDRELGSAGEVEYQAWLGTLNIPNDALDVSGATLDAVTTTYVTGGQVFWHPPVDGLRVGATYVRAGIDFNLTLDQANINAIVMAGLEPAGFDGKIVISQRPVNLWIGSAEYLLGDWLFAAEYSRWFTRQYSSLEAELPAFDKDNERFYAMVARRLSPWLETGGYYSVTEVDANDRAGHNHTAFPIRTNAFQRDLAATVRFDVNEHWLWKLEAHFMDGTADLEPQANPQPERYWGMFLFKTTVTF